jgi:hypothetical protein
MRPANAGEQKRWNEVFRFAHFLDKSLSVFEGNQKAFDKAFTELSLPLATSALLVEHSMEVLFSELLGLFKIYIDENVGGNFPVRMDAETTIRELLGMKAITHKQAQTLDLVRFGRNDLQHAHSRTLPGGVWREANALSGDFPELGKRLRQIFQNEGIIFGQPPKEKEL